jgi:succinate dehydrogenase/fumarate reductase flavoprotein subunit
MDTTFDVVVAGAGPGGMAAAVGAADAGARVVVLEALDEIGGNAIWSTGYMAFTGVEMQTASGIDDSAERFLADAHREVALQRERYGIVWDEELTREFIARSGDTYRFLTDYGVEFRRFIQRPLQHTADRMVDLVDTFALQRAFGRAFDERDVTVALRTRAQRLRTDGGRVVGVEADGPGGAVYYGATRGVILTTGGYQAGVDMRRRYQPEHLATTPYLGVATCRGDGHRMGQAVGADLLNMTMVQPLVIVASALVEDSIAVNLDGRRFHDEAGPYDDRVAALMQQRDRRAYYIFDDDTARQKHHLFDQMPEPGTNAATINALATTIGCPAPALQETVARWNALLGSDSRRDPLFGRVVLPADRRPITTPPFHAVRMVLGVNFPAGGFRTTDRMAVVDVFGQPIDGLWAAGDTVGGVNPCLGLGGIHISSAMTLGFVAGGAAATGEVGRVTTLPRAAEPPPPRGTTRMAIVDDAANASG